MKAQTIANKFCNLASAALITFALILAACPTPDSPGSVKTFSVTFESNGGSAIASQNIAFNGTATRPDDPVRAGYALITWHRNEGLTLEYDFETPVTGNITLYAAWSVEHRITIRYGGRDIEYNEFYGTFETSPLSVPANGAVSLTIGNYNDFASRDVVDLWMGGGWIAIDDFNSLPVEIRNRITADGIIIHLDSTATSNTDVDLRYIPYLRRLFVEIGVAEEKNNLEGTASQVYAGV